VWFHIPSSENEHESRSRTVEKRRVCLEIRTKAYGVLHNFAGKTSFLTGCAAGNTMAFAVEIE
jgi:hypothetical protein